MKRAFSGLCLDVGLLEPVMVCSGSTTVGWILGNLAWIESKRAAGSGLKSPRRLGCAGFDEGAGASGFSAVAGTSACGAGTDTEASTMAESTAEVVAESSAT